ncbi:MAG: S9 family peptidase [Planctomycetes bacterium]|nr:S9 family peptidase [Planctomycetota bacterium]
MTFQIPKNFKKILFIIISFTYSCSTGNISSSKNFIYPRTKTVNVSDNFHGTKVRDPYRWLEDISSEETSEWIELQNSLTRTYIYDSSARSSIKQRLEELYDFTRLSVINKKGNKYYFTKHEGLQNQPVLYTQNSLEDKPKVVIDTNSMSEDGTVALTEISFNNDASLLAYCTSMSGSDWQEIKIRDVNNNYDYSEAIRDCKFTTISWTKDNQSFFYSKFNIADNAPKNHQCNNKIFRHKIGTPSSTDQLVFEITEQPDKSLIPIVTKDGKYLIISFSKGTRFQNGVYYKELDSDKPFELLIEDNLGHFDLIGNEGSVFYFRTNFSAHNGKIIAINLSNSDRSNWTTVIPQTEDTISNAKIIGRQLAVLFLHHAYNKLKLFELNGTFQHQIELPQFGTIDSISGEPNDTEMFISFSSFLNSPTVYKYDLNSRDLITIHKSEIEFDFTQYETRQIFYDSKDGAKIPMFITHKKGIQLNGENPALLYGYGGFGIAVKPTFSSSRLIWLERGGIFAVANLRGGGEYGTDWHKAGILEKKQNVFNDFIAASQWLIDNKYTNKSKLAINGGSNGGLLVAACMIQRPDLFGAVVCQVPVIDMLRFHKFTVGHFWQSEYGNAEENKDHFNFLYKYSPLHNIRKGTTYPPTLILTGDTDDRVYPAHSLKFCAALQSNDSGINPILLRMDKKAGHGRGKPTSKVVEEITDIYTFLFKVFGAR